MIEDTKNAVNKKVVLLVVTMSSFIAPFMVSSVNIGLPAIGKEFTMDAISLSWVSLSYLLAAAMFLIPSGKIADVYGRKKIFSYGLSIDIVASLLISISTNETELILFRILQGIGEAMIFGTGVAILTSVYSLGERGKVLGINFAAVYSGLSLGPVVGGFITQHFGWRSIFLSYIPLELIIIILTFWKLKGEWADAQGERLDLTGFTIYGLSLMGIMYGFFLLPSIRGVQLIFFGILGVVVFVKWEMKTKNPVMNLNLFRNNSVFTFSVLAALINDTATFAGSFFLSLYLQYVKGFGAQTAGLVLMSRPIVMAIFSPLAGRLSDKIEPRIVATIGMAFTLVGLLMFSFLSEKTTLGYIIGGFILLGFGFALFSSPNTNAVMSSVEKKFYGVASATVATTRLAGQTISMGIATIILAMYLGKIKITPEYYSLFLRSVNTAFIIFAALCFIGLFVSLSRGKIR
ncbi:MAG: MFS transporter [Candidatus Methanoperedens sp.]|nr:MFS transporter [Candidatus Methanoperedens sp.]